MLELNDPSHWRDRAKKTRAKAEDYRIAPTERSRLLKIAAEYEQIADRAEEIAEADQQDIGPARTKQGTP